ncbi:MAG: hypothetical protein GY852_03615 [bacterium]|nr:hypothetical protein [bacterium]
MQKQHSNIIILTLAAIISSFLTVAPLMANTPYINKDVDAGIELVSSESHEFSYVRAYNDGDEFVLYGKVDHLHTYCLTEGHVDLTIQNAAGVELESTSLPIVKKGNRRKGWSGAHFRARLSQALPEGAKLKLMFHDPECFTGATFDCGRNIAVRAN